MSKVVRAALVQAEWTGDRDSMVEKNIGYAHDAANQGSQVICFQEIFNAPYFCNKQENQYFDTAEAIPDGPTVQAMIKVAKETGMVVLVPIFERVDEGTFYNTTAFINPDGEFLGIYRKTHIPQVEGFWEKFYFRPGNTGY
ncbi:MAG TPA: acyltransferase, partial [Actinobacteria bacterium]|nr:acyltransferase [Actinomycetota bacterium]